MKLVIVDLGCGNIGSVRLALGRFGIAPTVSADALEIGGANKVSLPGVGAAGYAMERVDALGLRDTLT
ncbi:MAG: imidazole glycerol phosphate synthase subunit HisH, partial [Sphingomonas sp.]|nr:imidazole glycerol phosphate synthase subunit HisH [Sphingomonas sp.]